MRNELARLRQYEDLQEQIAELEAERLQIQRAIAATATGDDGSEDDDVRYSLDEILDWIKRENDWRVKELAEAKAEAAEHFAFFEAERMQLAEERARLEKLATMLSVTHGDTEDEWQIAWKTPALKLWLSDGKSQAFYAAIDAAREEEGERETND